MFLKNIALFTLFFNFLLPVFAQSTEDKLPSLADEISDTQCAPFLDRKVRQLHKSASVDLCELTKGKVVVIVNTASHCGFTSQFKGLEALHKKYQQQGLVVIGFPSDDFFQEEDDEAETAEICFVNYGVTFTMLNTTTVRGSDADFTFKHLAEQTTSPKWNFYKYLVSRDGKKIQHFNSRVKPEDKEFVAAIEEALAQ